MLRTSNQLLLSSDGIKTAVLEGNIKVLRFNKANNGHAYVYKD